jgi:hypothetical protein
MQPKTKKIIIKVTKWITLIVFGFLFFQLLRLMFIMLFLGGNNPL